MRKGLERELHQRVKPVVDEAVKQYEALDKPDPQDMFKYVYAKMTPEMEEQMNEVKDEMIEKDDHDE